MKRNLQTPVSLAEIAQVLGAELRGDPSVTVRRLASLRKADTESISFLVRPQQREAAHASHAVAYIVSPRLVDDLPADIVIVTVFYLYINVHFNINSVIWIFLFNII